MNNFSLVIHGGAGTILKSNMTPEKEAKYTEALDKALVAGERVLAGDGSALDAVEASVVVLEDCPLFNAGRGSVFTAEGKHEMDAAIMEGKQRNAGAVTMVSGVRNPVSLAKLVMEKSGHVFLAAQGAEAFAKKMNCPMESDDWFFDELRHEQWLEVKHTDDYQLDHSPSVDRKFGTVGAVAKDKHGHLAAATSTGGMTNKKFGRVGDSPMIGAGTYANDLTCAVSCTGSGEFFIRGVVAYDVSCLMEFRGMSLRKACELVIHERVVKLNGDGGLIAVDGQGNVAMPFNTEGMYRGQSNGIERNIFIYR